MTSEMLELADRIERQGMEFKSEGGYLSDDDRAMIVAALRAQAAIAAQGEPAAIFQECAEIALEHLGQCGPGKRGQLHLSYDEACRDIAEAIRLRASNRKTMDAIADATLLKP